MKDKIRSFEDKLKHLEKLVDQMESGDLSLDEALAHFEQGIAVTRECQQILAAAEQRVKMLVENQEQAELVELPES